MKARTYSSKIHIGSLFSHSLPLVYVPVGTIVRVYSIATANMESVCIAELKGASDRVKIIQEVAIENKLHLLVGSSYELMIFKVNQEGNYEEHLSTDTEEAIHFTKIEVNRVRSDKRQFPWKVSRFALESKKLYLARKNSKVISQFCVESQEIKDFYEFETKLKRLKTMKVATISQEEYLLVSNYQSVYFVHINSGSQVLELKVPMGMISEVASSEGKIAYSDTFGKIRVVSLKRKDQGLQVNSSQTLLWHAHSVKVLKFNSINYLYSGGQEGVIVLWQLLQGQKNFIAHLGYRIFDLCISPDNSIIAVTLENNKIFLLDSQNFKPHLLFQTIAPLRKLVNSTLLQDKKTGALVVPQVGGWLQFVEMREGVVNKRFDINVSGRNYVSKLEHTDPDPFVEVKQCCQIGTDYLVTLQEIKLDCTLQKVKIWKRGAISEFQLLSTFQNSLNSYLSEEIKAVVSPQNAPISHFLEIKDTHFNIWNCSPEDQRLWVSQNYGEFRHKKIGAYEYSEKCKRAGAIGAQFLLIAFETALTTWEVATQSEKVSYSLTSSFSFPKVHGAIEQLALSENNRYLCVRKQAGIVGVYRFNNMEMLWEDSIPNSVLFLKGGSNRFALLDQNGYNLMVYDYTSKVPTHNKAIKRKTPSQPDDQLAIAGFYAGSNILLIYESGTLVRVANQDELLNGGADTGEEVKRDSTQKSLTQKLRDTFKVQKQDQEEMLQGKEELVVKNLRRKLGLRHISGKFKKQSQFEESKRSDDLAQQFEKFLKLTEPTISEERQATPLIENIGIVRKVEDKKEEEKQLRAISEFPKIDELRAMIKRDASELI